MPSVAQERIGDQRANIFEAQRHMNSIEAILLSRGHQKLIALVHRISESLEYSVQMLR